MPTTSLFQPAAAWLELGAGFADAVEPAKFPTHTLRFRNQRWAEQVGLGDLTAAEWEAHFARFVALPGSLPQPLATRYHGHQFRHYNPRLGDGRGFLFAQLTAPDGRLLDLGTKGSGTTPYSRGGDGRLTLKGGVREILATEMLEAQGVYTSKTFSLFETGESLYRGDEPSPTRSSVLVRLSHSHVRFGTFQYHAFHQKPAHISALVDYCVRHFYPEIVGETIAERAVQLLARVAERMACLTASWTTAGFVHGVLNTDNMCITGESFDYGPWRWTPTLDPAFTAAYFDETGLYAFSRQASAVLWNLNRLADCLALVAPDEDLRAVLAAYPDRNAHWLRFHVLRRLGLAQQDPESDDALVQAAFGFLHESGVSLDRFWFDWYGGMASLSRPGTGRAEYSGSAFRAFRQVVEHYQASQPERLAHPYFADDAPCSMIIDEVESIWAPIAESDDWSRLNAKVDAIRRMGEALGHAPIAP